MNVNVMCNLSQGVKEEGIGIGETRFMLSMHESGYTLEQTLDASKNIEEVKAIIEKREPISA